MRAILLFSLIVGLDVLCAMGQAINDLPAHHEKAVEENLRYATVIKGRPDPGMSLLEQMSKLHVPGVSIAVVHGMRVEWAKGYGVSRLGGPPVSTSTLFSAASMSKPLTAMAVLRLVQEGKVDLDTDVNTYLKSWKLPANQYTNKHSVTIRELLNHTSGIGTHSGAIYDPNKGVPSTLQILDGTTPATTPPVRVESEPGRKYAYANGGYLILELLITDLTGETFAQAMEELVLAPLGMNQSISQRRCRQIERRTLQQVMARMEQPELPPHTLLNRTQRQAAFGPRRLITPNSSSSFKRTTRACPISS